MKFQLNQYYFLFDSMAKQLIMSPKQNLLLDDPIDWDSFLVKNVKNLDKIISPITEPIKNIIKIFINSFSTINFSSDE